MYGPAGTAASTSKEEAQSNTESSDIKKVVDQWYTENIENTGYSGAVSDTLFCNDRSTPGSSISEWTSDTGLGYGNKTTAYGARTRFIKNSSPRENIQPAFKCPQKSDAFTVSDTTKGNGALDKPVGLITADEILAAGSGETGMINRGYYLNKESKYWSLSPFNYSGSSYVLQVYSSGYLSYLVIVSVNNAGAVAPVINLKPEYVNNMVGDGTISNPYRVEV